MLLVPLIRCQRDNFSLPAGLGSFVKLYFADQGVALVPAPCWCTLYCTPQSVWSGVLGVRRVARLAAGLAPSACGRAGSCRKGDLGQSVEHNCG